MAGCRCPQCWTLFEHMESLTGRTHGLRPAPGHAPPHLREVEKPSSSMTELDPEEFRRLQELARKRQSDKPFPWENQAA